MIKSDSSAIVKAKQLAGQAAVQYVQEGMLVGLGTGSTSAYFIEALGLRCRQGLKISAVATSKGSRSLAEQSGIPVVDDNSITSVDLTVDGADEIDEKFQIIKGGGGALMREKILAQSSRQWIVIVDETKVVKQLGKFPVPVEICPFAYATTVHRLKQEGYQGKIRMRGSDFYVTDNGNYIFDLSFSGAIDDAYKEDLRLREIAGILETGFFYNKVYKVIVGTLDGNVKVIEFLG